MPRFWNRVVNTTRCCAWKANDNKKNSAIAGSAGSIQNNTSAKAGLLNIWVAIWSLRAMPTMVAGIVAVAIQSRPLFSFSCAKSSVPCADKKRRMTLSSPRRNKMESTANKVKPRRNKPASSLGMLRVTSAVRAKAAKAAAVLAPAAKASFISVAVRPVASW